MVFQRFSGCGVTANMLVLGTSDSGFESRHPDNLSKMEGLPKNQKESGISRIVGVDESQEADILRFFGKEFETEVVSEFFKEHSKELDDLIGFLNERLKSFLSQYGIDSIFIPEKRVCVFDNKKILHSGNQKLIDAMLMRLARGNRAMFQPALQHIVMMNEYNDGEKVRFAQDLVHEMLHFNSFVSLQKTLDDKNPENLHLSKVGSGHSEDDNLSLAVRRVGFRIYVDDKEVFHDIDEAVITELTMRFDQAHFSQFPGLESELKLRDDAVGTGLDKTKYQSMIANVQERKIGTKIEVSLGTHPYGNERGLLNKLIDDIFLKNQSDFSSREEVFSLFATASMSGNLLPVARLVEKTFGKGSFRVIGEETKKKS